MEKITGLEKVLRKLESPGETAIRHFCDAMDRGKTPDAETLNFLNEAFKKIRSGVDPKAALQLKKRRGRKDTYAIFVRDKLPAAYEVWSLMRAGVPYAEAVNQAAKKFHLGDRSVERHYAQAKAAIKSQERFLEILRKTHRRKPPTANK